jgi:hypothetical protein
MASDAAALDMVVAADESDKRQAFPDWLLGVSFAATWTWAVSILVGMALLREQGIIPFFTWFAANVAAIPLFGYVSHRYPWLWAETRRPVMRAVMTVMLALTLWINLTGIVTMGDTLEWLSHGVNVAIAIATGVFLWAVTRRWGILWSVLSDRVQWWGLYGAVIAALAVTVAQDGLHLDATLKLGSYSGFRDWWLSLWTVPLLLTNPFIDGASGSGLSTRIRCGRTGGLSGCSSATCVSSLSWGCWGRLTQRWPCCTRLCTSPPPRRWTAPSQACS